MVIFARPRAPGRSLVRSLVGRAKGLRLSAANFSNYFIANHPVTLFLTPTFWEKIHNFLIHKHPAIHPGQF